MSDNADSQYRTLRQHELVPGFRTIEISGGYPVDETIRRVGQLG